MTAGGKGRIRFSQSRYRTATSIADRAIPFRQEKRGTVMKPGIWSVLLIAIIAAGICALAFPPAAAADSLTRGSMFTVSIAGKPVTAYYVWFFHTFAMSGEPGDQPPVIVDNQYNVEFDPDGGPYAIGSYQYYNGNGRTILNDVAPSSATTSNTRYYAKVTTDADGYGIVQFSTSSATADRTFAVHAENPLAPGQEVPVALGLPVKATAIVTTRTTMATTAATTVPATTIRTTITTPATETTAAAIPTTTMQETTAAPAPATTQKSPPGPVIAAFAAVIGIAFGYRKGGA